MKRIPYSRCLITSFLCFLFSNAFTQAVLEKKLSLTLESGIFADGFLSSNESADLLSRGIPLLLAVELHPGSQFMKNLSIPEYISGGIYLTRVPVNFRTRGTQLSRFGLWSGGLRGTVSISKLFNMEYGGKYLDFKNGDFYAGAQLGVQSFRGLALSAARGNSNRFFGFPFIGVRVDASQHMGLLLELGKSAQSFVNFGVMWSVFSKTEGND